MAHLMNNAVWFGTENDMRWVPAPAANYASQQVRWRAVDQLLNGGARIRQSRAGHKALSLVWPVQSQESLAPVVNYLTQDEPLYYVDPLNAQSNALPAYWAAPGVIPDGPELIPGADIEYTLVATGKDLNYPVKAISFTLATTTYSNIKLPIPNGYTAFIGVHGTGADVIANGISAPKIALTSTQRTNLQVSNVPFLTLGFLTGAHVVNGIVVQMLPTGQAPIAGGFLPGLGHSALEVSEDPTITSYSANLPNAQTGIAVDFVEVGAWS